MEKPDYSEQVARYKAFMLLTGALVFILVGCTICLWYNKMNAADYEKVLLMLGVPTLLGMAFHAFFNENKEEKQDAKTIEVSADHVDAFNSGNPGQGGESKPQ